jgi:hypothetical protein
MRIGPGQGDEEWASKDHNADYLFKLLGKMGPDDQNLILHMAQKVAKRSYNARQLRLPQGSLKSGQ